MAVDPHYRTPVPLRQPGPLVPKRHQPLRVQIIRLASLPVPAHLWQSSIRQLFQMRVQVPVKVHSGVLEATKREMGVAVTRHGRLNRTGGRTVLHDARVFQKSGVALRSLEGFGRVIRAGRSQAIYVPAR